MFKRSITAGITPTGLASFVSGTVRTVEGALAMAGELAKKYVAHRSQSGNITPTGDNARKARYPRTLTGDINPAGVLDWISGQLISGVVSFAGVLTKKIAFKRSVSGDIGSSGNTEKTAAWYTRLTSGVLFLTGRGTRPSDGVIKRGLMRLGKWFNLK
jgi:hypothetical protein